VTDDSQLQITPKDGSSLTLTNARSGLIARGRTDAALLLVPERTDQLSRTHPLVAAWLAECFPDWEKEEDPEAQFNIGFELTDAGFDDPDTWNAEAVRWLRKAAEQGHVEAQFSLGYTYTRGMGVEQDDAEAVRWWRKAADQGHTFAQHDLGIAYHLGRGITQDDAEAVSWFRKAADQGYTTAASLELMRSSKGV
jgi:TPR repeat protein